MSEGSGVLLFDQVQVQYGKKFYGDVCVKCYGDQFEGNIVFVLSGELFVFEGKLYIMVGGIFLYMLSNMLVDCFGKMIVQEYEDLMVFLFYLNGYDVLKSKLIVEIVNVLKVLLIVGLCK